MRAAASLQQKIIFEEVYLKIIRMDDVSMGNKEMLLYSRHNLGMNK